MHLVFFFVSFYLAAALGDEAQSGSQNSSLGINGSEVNNLVDEALKVHSRNFSLPTPPYILSIADGKFYFHNGELNFAETPERKGDVTIQTNDLSVDIDVELTYPLIQYESMYESDLDNNPPNIANASITNLTIYIQGIRDGNQGNKLLVRTFSITNGGNMTLNLASPSEIIQSNFDFIKQGLHEEIMRSIHINFHKIIDNIIEDLIDYLI